MKDNFSKKALISFLIILASIIIAAGALYYFSNDLAVQSAKIALGRQAVSGESDALSSLAVLESQAPRAAGYASAMDQLLPDQYGTVNFNNWLAKEAKKYSVTASSQFSGDTTLSTPSAPGTVSFTLTASGPSKSVVPFLQDIESQAPGFIFTLSSFDYTSDPSGERITAQGVLFFK